MAILIKDIFDDSSKDIKYDKVLAKRITKYLANLMNMNEDHVLFFGSNLTGVYPLRFKTSDRNEWLIDIMDVDEHDIKRRVIKDAKVNPDWVRATDVFNLDCLYTMHRFLISDLPEREKQQAVDDVAMILNIKLISSIVAAYFKYSVDERVAQEVYSRLSRKFYIKKFGNWRKVLEHRSADITAKSPKWRGVLQAFTSNEDIAQCISDIQGRLRSMIKYIWEVLDEVRQDEMKFNKTSMSIETGGEKIIQELKRDSDILKRYILKTALEPRLFLKPELVTIVQAEMRTMPEKPLYDIIDHLTTEVGKGNEKAEQYLNDVIEFTVNTIQSDRTASRNMDDLGWLLNKMKLLITAAKANDPLVFSIREESEILVKKSAKTRNNTLIASLRTGLTLYVIARAFTKKHYG